MIVYFSVFAICFLLALLHRFNFLQYKSALLLIFSILSIYSGIRYDYGNDYGHYVLFFEKINDFTYTGREIEFGYTLINKLFPNFYTVVGVTSLLVSYSYFVLFRSYLDSKYLWLAILLLFFNTSFLIGQYSGIRNAIAINVFMLSFSFMVKRKLFPFLIAMGFASFFHKSAILMMPVYYLISPKKFNEEFVWVVFILTCIYFVFNGFFVDKISSFVADNYFESYDVYNEKFTNDLFGGKFTYKEFILLIGKLLSYFLLLKTLATSSKTSEIIVLKLMVLFYLVSFTNQVGLISRINFYLGPFFIVGSTLVLSKLKENLFKSMYILYHISFSLFYFLKWTEGSTFGKYVEYRTIFEIL